MNALMAFQINGIHAVNQRYEVRVDFTGHEPGACTLQNRTYFD